MKPLIISGGDPAGIGPEIVFKALREFPDEHVIVVCDWGLTVQHLETVGIGWEGRVVRNDDLIPASGHAVYDVSADSATKGERLRAGQPGRTTARAALDSIDTAIRLMNEGRGQALVTAPVSKFHINDLGAPFTGHTEHLAAQTGREVYGRDYAMMFDSPTLTTVLASVHVPLRRAVTMLAVEPLVALIELTRNCLISLGAGDPNIAVAGLNPHAGEGGMFGEEDEIVRKAVEHSAATGANVSGPFPPDTIFYRASQGQFDVVVALYHDQGLIPVKLLHFDDSVNVTIGLPWLRVSVDHGTAFDIAGQGVASDAPMRYAIEWALRHSGNEGGGE